MSGMSICGCLWIAFGVLWLVWALRSKPTQMRESLGSRFSHVVATVAAFYAMFSGDVPLGWMHTRVVPRGPWVEALGIALTVAGMAFAIWARAYLGGNWSSNVTLKVGHQLVRTGPYRWVRHPIYSGLILAMIGTALNRARCEAWLRSSCCGWASPSRAESKNASWRRPSGRNMTSTGEPPEPWSRACSPNSHGSRRPSSIGSTLKTDS